MTGLHNGKGCHNCMRACIHLYVHIHMHTVMQYACVYNNVCMYVCTHAMYGYTYKNAYNYVRMYICMYAHVNACMKVADPLLITSKISKTIICKISGNLSVLCQHNFYGQLCLKKYAPPTYNAYAETSYRKSSLGTCYMLCYGEKC